MQVQAVVPCAAAETELTLVNRTNGKRVKVRRINGSVYVVPSDQHVNAPRRDLGPLTMRELEEQSFDSELGEFVYDFKNYDVGDVVHFRDKIVRLEYDRKEDVTYFAFVSAYEADRVVEWPFRGNLTSQYKVGDLIDLYFRVVYDQKPFETLDYLKYGMTHGGKAPAINQYLMGQK